MKNILCIYILLFALTSCNNESNNKTTDTTTSGEINISCDESLKPIIEAEEAVFEELYPNAELNIIYTNEQNAINLVLQDSARAAIITRKMSNEEEFVQYESGLANVKDVTPCGKVITLPAGSTNEIVPS